MRMLKHVLVTLIMCAKATVIVTALGGLWTD